MDFRHTIDEVIQTLEVLRSNSEAAKYCRNLEGTIWILKNRVERVSAAIGPVLDGEQRSDISSAFSELSTAATDRSYRRRDPWRPSSWFVRGGKWQRRYSGEANTLKANFQERCRRVRCRFRRRNSLDCETLLRAHLSQNSLAATKPCWSNPANEMGFWFECPGSSSAKEFFRTHPTLRGHVLEIWPETITNLLTARQLVIDRSILLDSLFEKLCDEQREGDFPTRATSGLSMLCGGLSIARPDKNWGGEDAFFISDFQFNFIGVADGVGEWGELGASPRAFADELMAGAEAEAAILRARGLLLHPSELARQAISAGFRATKSFGSSTASVVALDAEGKLLGIANIGDSGCLVLRRDEKFGKRHFVPICRTKEQQHFFNCPFQLSRVPRQEDLPMLQARGMHKLVRALGSLDSSLQSDTPAMADAYDVSVQQGDLVILGTDGVFDNLLDSEIASLVSLAVSPWEAAELAQRLADQGSDPFLPLPNALIPPVEHEQFGLATPAQNVAQAIAEAAFYRSLNPRAWTPFSQQSRKLGRFITGGKMDDITCVVSWIV